MSVLGNVNSQSIALSNDMKEIYKYFDINETLLLMDLLHKFVRRKTGDLFRITENDAGILFFSYHITIDGEIKEIYTFDMNKELFLKEIKSPVKLIGSFATIREVISLSEVIESMEEMEEKEK